MVPFQRRKNILPIYFHFFSSIRLFCFISVGTQTNERNAIACRKDLFHAPSHVRTHSFAPHTLKQMRNDTGLAAGQPTRHIAATVLFSFSQD